MAESFDAVATVHPAANPSWGRLVRSGFARLIGHVSAPDSAPLRLVLVSDRSLEPLVSDLRAACPAAAHHVLSIAGDELGRRLLAGDRRLAFDRSGDDVVRVVIVDRLDRLGGPRRQRLAAAWLDRLTAAGIGTCLTVERSAKAAGLDPALDSRLAEGLIVHIPCRPTAAEPATARSLASIVRSTARRCGVPADEVTGRGRGRSTVEVRNLAMYLARRMTGSSYHAIGVALGGRDHTTVLRGIRSIEHRIEHDAAFATEVEALTDTVGQGSRPPRRATG